MSYFDSTLSLEFSDLIWHPSAAAIGGGPAAAAFSGKKVIYWSAGLYLFEKAAESLTAGCGKVLHLHSPTILFYTNTSAGDRA